MVSLLLAGEAIFILTDQFNRLLYVENKINAQKQYGFHE
jgi:hypothetical protein